MILTPKVDADGSGEIDFMEFCKVVGVHNIPPRLARKYIGAATKGACHEAGGGGERASKSERCKRVRGGGERQQVTSPSTTITESVLRACCAGHGFDTHEGG